MQSKKYTKNIEDYILYKIINNYIFIRNKMYASRSYEELFQGCKAFEINHEVTMIKV